MKLKQKGYRVRLYPLLGRAIDEGLAYGYRRAYKHCEKPTEDELRGAMYNAVMSELSELFDFEDGDEDT